MYSELYHVSREALLKRVLRAEALCTLQRISRWNLLEQARLLGEELAAHEKRYNPNQPREACLNKRGAASITPSMQDARAAIEDEMERAARIIHDAAQDHLQAFARRMREKIGGGEIALSEPYLPFLLAQGELEYLLRLERAEAHFAPVKTVYLTIPNPENTGTPGGNGISDAIGRETRQSVLRLNQRLDSARQQSFGITHYIWEGGDCPLCAANNGQVFEWGEGDEPGDVHPNCNCTADPVVESAGEPNPPETPPGTSPTRRC